jgi:hypothetical protein
MVPVRGRAREVQTTRPRGTRAPTVHAVDRFAIPESVISKTVHLDLCDYVRIC